MADVPRRLSIVLLAALLFVCFLRARSQSFTTDEAFVFRLYVSQPLIEMARHYDACNHVLHTLLMKICRSVFGITELALRVPSLIGALLYFVAVYRLSVLLFGGWVQLLAVAALVLHPLVLDFLVAARGYGLALALLMCSLYFAVAWLVKGFQARDLWKSGVCAGLAVGANLTAAVPVLALGLLLLWFATRQDNRPLPKVLDGWAGPAFVPAFLLLLFPAMAVSGGEFYYGAGSLRDTVTSLVLSIAKAESNPGFLVVHRYAPFLTSVLIPLLVFLLCGAGLVLAWRERRSRVNFRTAPFLLLSGVLAVTILLLFAAHHWKGVPYPYFRTGLYLPPLFTLALLLGCRALSGGRWRQARLAGYAFAGCVTVLYLSQTDNRYFVQWRGDASVNRLLRLMHDDYYRRQPTAAATVAASSGLSEVVEYYRVRRSMDWLKPPVDPHTATSSADYFLVIERDAPLVEKPGLEVVERDALSRTILARKRL